MDKITVHMRFIGIITRHKDSIFGTLLQLAANSILILYYI